MSYYETRNLTHVMELGSGAVGTVGLYTNIDGNKRAVKNIKLIAGNRPLFHREVEIMKDLQKSGGHPNIMKYYHSKIIGNTGYLEYEYVDGIDVEDLMGIFVKTNSKFFFKIAIGVLQGLEFLHKLGIYHRDIGGQNVLICIDHDDPDMPFKAKIIDLGIGCKVNGNKHNTCSVRIGAQSRFDWPYNDNTSNTQKALECGDIWLTGNLLFNIAYGADFDLFNDSGSYGMMAQVFHMRMPIKGGYPLPPDLSTPRLKKIMIPQPPPLDALVEDQAKIVQLYADYVVGRTRDPVFDFDITKESPINDVLRLMLAREEKHCFSASEVLTYIKSVWTDDMIVTPYPQRRKINSCRLPCEDPSNNYYKNRCDKCTHCVWNDEGFRKGMETIHCSTVAPNSRSEQDKRDCLNGPRKGIHNVWNPYRKTCEIVMDEPITLLSNRYSIMYSDGTDVPVNGLEIKRRIIERDRTLLDSDAIILKRLTEFPYHPLKTEMSHSFFYNYFRDRKPQSPMLLKANITEFSSRIDRSVNSDLQKNPKTRVDHDLNSSKRYTYLDPVAVPSKTKPKVKPPE
jgi:serine/threonine protein kinase